MMLLTWIQQTEDNTPEYHKRIRFMRYWKEQREKEVSSNARSIRSRMFSNNWDKEFIKWDAEINKSKKKGRKVK